jgi:hypothetical protein
MGGPSVSLGSTWQENFGGNSLSVILNGTLCTLTQITMCSVTACPGGDLNINQEDIKTTIFGHIKKKRI